MDSTRGRGFNELLPTIYMNNELSSPGHVPGRFPTVGRDLGELSHRCHQVAR